MDRRESQQRAPELILGQRFTARVEALLPDHRFRALVQGRRMLLLLPAGTRLGETLALVVLDRTADGVIAGPIVYTPFNSALRRLRRRTKSSVGKLSRVIGTCCREVYKWIPKA